MRTLKLKEYQTTRGVALSQDELESLQTLISSLDITPCIGRRRHYDLTPGSVIGMARTESLLVEIRPKLPVQNVLFLMSYALNPKAWKPTQVWFHTSDDLLESIIPGFVHQVLTALERGLLHDYRTEENSLNTIRGRIRMQDQIKHRFGIAPPIELEYDEYTPDIIENRLIKAALSRLRKLPIRSEEASRSLEAFDLALQPVTLISYDPQSLPDILYTRLNEHYRSAVELSKLILLSSSIEFGPGTKVSSSFLIDMNQLFEDFVVTALRETLGLSRREFVQGAKGCELTLDEQRQVRLRPDISWWDRTECVFVGDIKYKKLIPPGMQHADVYQLLSYTVATGLSTGLLIYATGEDNARTHDVVHVGKSLKIVTLELAGDPSVILSEIERAGTTILAMRESMGVSAISRQERITEGS